MYRYVWVWFGLVWNGWLVVWLVVVLLCRGVLCALFTTTSSKVPSRGQRRGRLRLDADLEAAEDGHVVGHQVRRASWRDQAQHDVTESGLYGGQGGLAGVDAGHVTVKDPRLSFLARFQYVVQSGRDLQDRGCRCSGRAAQA